MIKILYRIREGYAMAEQRTKKTNQLKPRMNLEKTNEELAIMVQQGEPGSTLRLWENCKALIRQQAARFHTGARSLCIHAGVEFDDLMQCGFLALLDAVKAYDPATGYKFLTYLTYPLQNRFKEAIGQRSKKEIPLNQSTSLDKLTGEEGAATLGEVIPDPAAEEQMEAVIDREFQGQLHEVMEQCLSTMPPEQVEVIRRRYYEGKKGAALCEVCGHPYDWIRNREVQALRSLRRPDRSDRLRPFLEEAMGIAYHGSFRSFNSTWASSTERTVERLEELKHKFQRPDIKASGNQVHISER